MPEPTRIKNGYFGWRAVRAGNVFEIYNSHSRLIEQVPVEAQDLIKRVYPGIGFEETHHA